MRGLEGGVNLYVYVMGNPVNRTDREGLEGSPWNMVDVYKYFHEKTPLPGLSPEQMKQMDQARAEFAGCTVVCFGKVGAEAAGHEYIIHNLEEAAKDICKKAVKAVKVVGYASTVATGYDIVKCVWVCGNK